jgi:predicted esterase
LAIYHGVLDDGVPLNMAISFSETLTNLNVEHQYIEVDVGHCDRSWDYTDVLKFMSTHLADE